MNKEPGKYKRLLFAGITVIALGITFTTSLKDTAGSLGIIFIAIGGLLVIIGIKQKHSK